MYQKKLKDEKKDRHWSFLLYVLNTIDYVKKLITYSILKFMSNVR